MGKGGHRKAEQNKGALSAASSFVPRQPEEVIESRRTRIEQKRYVWSFVLRLVLLAATLVLIFSFVFGIAVMHGEDMYPRLRDGDMFLYYRLEKQYHVGDVVTFAKDGTRYTARIVASGGDTVDMTDADQLLVNGNVQDEEIFYQTSKTEAVISFPCVVEENSYFLLSDFRTTGEDSRTYGPVTDSQLDGKLIALLRRRGL